MSARLLPPLSVTVSVHVHADTPMRVVLHPELDAGRRESTGEPGGTRPDEVRDPAA